MPATIEHALLDELVLATCDVFRTMVFTEVYPATPIQGEALRGGTNVVGTIAFTGGTSGLVVFYSTIDAARHITGVMLGMDPSAVRDELPDAIGELTNMIAGSFRTRVAHARRETWAISVPTVTVGSDFSTRFVRNVRRTLCPFTMGDRDVFVELIVTTSAGRA
ncbi:MAG: chemotaxis protein CheX [Vicinamibacterales bacterium]